MNADFSRKAFPYIEMKTKTKHGTITMTVAVSSSLTYNKLLIHIENDNTTITDFATHYLCIGNRKVKQALRLVSR